jgi:molybdate transport system substrate-binding protein
MRHPSSFARMLIRRVISAIGLFSMALGCSGASRSVSVAAAANLTYALDAINAEFRRIHPGVVISTAYGASGNLFAQIQHGAPFDVFLSADTNYPEELAKGGLGIGESLYNFAAGRLVLWTTRQRLDITDLPTVIKNSAVKKIAIASPKTAPYGHAAQAAMEKLGVWGDAQPKLVTGENISQTAQFVETGNADIGFVALSLVLSSRLTNRGKWREVASELYAAVPLDHALILTTKGNSNSAAHEYVAFLRSAAAKAILERFGYHVPAAP